MTKLVLTLLHTNMFKLVNRLVQFGNCILCDNQVHNKEEILHMFTPKKKEKPPYQMKP